jgi:hypothetical protein
MAEAARATPKASFYFGLEQKRSRRHQAAPSTSFDFECLVHHSNFDCSCRRWVNQVDIAMSALSSAIHNAGHCHVRPGPVCLPPSRARSANNWHKPSQLLRPGFARSATPWSENRVGLEAQNRRRLAAIRIFRSGACTRLWRASVTRPTKRRSPLCSAAARAAQEISEGERKSGRPPRPGPETSSTSRTAQKPARHR